MKDTADSGTQDSTSRHKPTQPKGSKAKELAGCMADGETRLDALHNAERVINEWIETAQELGREIPAPRGRLRYA